MEWQFSVAKSWRNVSLCPFPIWGSKQGIPILQVIGFLDFNICSWVIKYGKEKSSISSSMIYIYTYEYIHMNIYIWIYAYEYIHMNFYIWIDTNERMSMYIYIYIIFTMFLRGKLQPLRSSAVVAVPSTWNRPSAPLWSRHVEVRGLPQDDPRDQEPGKTWEKWWLTRWLTRFNHEIYQIEPDLARFIMKNGIWMGF